MTPQWLDSGTTPIDLRNAVMAKIDRQTPIGWSGPQGHGVAVQCGTEAKDPPT
ncbi:MAG TPA: hypothetical protein VN444_04595 [Verrucomicrobiae bacterium]|nr:hypothetical protein [Verrucomicrobiae bacterium]